MTQVRQQNAPFEAVFPYDESGLTISVQIIDNQGAVVFGPTSAGIIETPAGLGVYVKPDMVAPAVLGQYSIVSDDGEGNTTVEDLYVVDATAASDVLPPLPAGEAGSVVCTPWADADDVLACSSFGEDLGSEAEDVLLPYLYAASEVLFGIAPRFNGGGCSVTVRPCTEHCSCGFQVLSRGHIVAGWHGHGWELEGCHVGCCGVSRVKLPGWPVTSITEVVIDGEVIDPDGYRLDEGRYLVRLADEDGVGRSWPGCQRMDLPDSEVGTFSVSYLYGQPPPQSGRLAAATLAGQWYLACVNNGEGCTLAPGVTRLIRQGTTIETGLVAQFIREGRTGLMDIDLFASQFGGTQPAAAVWSPDVPGYARPVR